MAYRVGVVGCRGIGVRHASGLLDLENAELAAGCDISEEILGEFLDQYRETWPQVAAYTDFEEMLAQEDLDVVTVATSDHRHADLVVGAAEAGVKGIFCEKPMATSLADADRMIEAVERNGVILSIDHTRRWQPLWRHTKEGVVDDGAIGQVLNIIGTLRGPRAMLFRNGTHLIDTICYFAGGEPEWVSAELEEGYESYAEYEGDGGHVPETEPGAHGYIHFSNGVRALYVGGPKTTPEPAITLEVVGTEGIVRIDGDTAALHKGGEAQPIEAPTWEVEGIPAGIQELIQLLDAGGTPVSSGRDGLRVVEVIMGFLESQQRDNGKVALPQPR